MVRALLDAEAFVNAAPESAKKQLAGILKLSPQTFDPAWQDVTPQGRTAAGATGHARGRGDLGDGAGTTRRRQPMPNFVSHLALDTLLAVSPERVTVVR